MSFVKLMMERVMNKLYVGLMAGVMAAASAHAADEPVVIGDVTMPAVQSSTAHASEAPPSSSRSASGRGLD